MAFRRSPSLVLLLPLFLLAPHAMSSHHGRIAVYWGWGIDNGNLTETCKTHNYAFVILTRLPGCDPANNGCAGVSTQIKACQSMGIKVFLSINGDLNGVVPLNLTSASAAQSSADFLWNNFLGGSSSSRPLGDAVLDGIDFNVVPLPDLYYDVLAKGLSTKRETGRRVYLSAAPQCAFPDPFLGKAISTGLFDYMWVQFYNDATCDYSGGNFYDLEDSWYMYTTMPVKQLFFGVAAGGVMTGIISPSALISQVLPMIKRSPKYAGIMLWCESCEPGYANAVKSSL